jgi:L-alanine-DL-glutamate epimerase-like enolase superfamily enzyme
VEVSARVVTLRLRETFRIAYKVQDEAQVVHVELLHDGIRGFGEAAPFDRYGETPESALAFVEEAAPLLGDDPFALEEIGAALGERPGEMAAKAALDAALHDLCGKLVGLPVWRLLGLRRQGPPTAYTIGMGDPDEMARTAERAPEGVRRLKLKLGGRDGQDVERVRAVRAVAQCPLQVDANEAWSVDEALGLLSELTTLGVEYCEQPLKAGDPGGAELRERSPIPVYVDEDCKTLSDLTTCAEIANGINIKLAKSGGIREAVRMAHAARALGLGVMLGCMIESGLGIAAGAQIASLCDYVDLDGNLLIAEDPWPGVPFVDGYQLAPDVPGLGVHAAEAVPGPR